MVLVANQVQDQPLARGEADPELPFLPAHLVAVDGEAGAFRLGDLHRLQILPGTVREMRRVRGVADPFGGVVTAARRERHHPVVLDIHHFHTIEVEADDQAFHRAGVSVIVAVALAHPGQRPDEPALAGRVLGAVVTGRPRVDHHHVEVGDAAAAHRLLPAGVLPHRFLGGQKLFEHDRRLDIGQLPPQPHLAGGDRDHRLVGPAFGPFAQHDMRLAVECLAPLVAQDRVLVRFVQRDVDEAGALGQATVLLEDLAGDLDLLRRQRLQRVLHRHPDLLGRRHRPLLPWLRKPWALADGSGVTPPVTARVDRLALSTRVP